jgi:hypothetical protein
MKKFVISESEKSEILKKHNDFKSILQENLKTKNNGVLVEQIQKLSGDDLIKAAKKSCTKLQSASTVNFKNGKLALKLTATIDGPMDAATNKPKYVTGNVIIYTSDLNSRGELIYHVYDGNTKKASYTWSCKAINAQADDFQKTSSDQKIKAEGWMTFEEAKAAGVNLSDPKFFEQKKINGVEYFRKRGITVGGAGSKEQEQVIDFLNTRYGNRFQRLKDTLDSSKPDEFCWAFQGEQPTTEPVWNLNPVVGGAEFGVEGLQIFRNPACLKGVRDRSKTVVSTEAGQRRVDNKGCKTTIDEYLQAYEDDVDTTSTAFQEMKRTVMACKRKFCSKNIQKTQGRCDGNWNLGLMGGSRRMDNIIDFFSGEENTIGDSPSRTNPFRIA